MNDLSGVEWTAPRPSTGQQYPRATGNYYPALRPTPPLSGRSTPSLLQQNQKAPGDAPARSNSSTPAEDTFANLVSFNASQSTKGLSLQEQQRKIHEEKAKQEAERRRAFDAQFGSSQAAPTISYGSNTPNGIKSPPAYSATSEYGGHKLSKIINKPFAGIPTPTISSAKQATAEDENDLLAAFDSSAPVDRSSHMPDISRATSVDTSSQGAQGSAISPSPSEQVTNGTSGGYNENLDDDPFGLGMAANKSSTGPVIAANEAVADDDDVLGLLGRPVSEFAQMPEAKSVITEVPPDVESHTQDHAVAELVDMGFPPDRARRALEATESGTDLQAAVGWLLNQAHEQTSKRTRSNRNEIGREDRTRTSRTRPAPARRRGSSSEAAKPAWMQDQGRLSSHQNRASSKSPVDGEKDPAQYASELGNKVFKTAGSLWKTGTKKLNQAVQEFNSDSDSSQPKWMKDTQPESVTRKPRSQDRENDVQDHDRIAKKLQKGPAIHVADSSVTDEAMMLEAESRPPPRKPRTSPNPITDGPGHQREKTTPITSKTREQTPSQPKFMQQASARDVKTKLSRQAVEAETSQAYISPARRKRPTPKTAPAESQADLLFESSKTPSEIIQSRPTPSPQPRAIPTKSIPPRQTPPKRNIPSLSSFALRASTTGRQEGNAAFKRGDYAQATTHYSKSLSAIPTTHPLAIVVLTNRALSHSKTGDPKASIADAKSALDLIGSSRGLGEVVDLGDEGPKQMSTYWEKATMRQAEALEHLERWSEAAAVWRTCVEAGIGGATSSAGRNRCEKAAAPASQSNASSAPKKAVTKPRPKPTALGDLAPDSESVTRLRAANAAADRLDDEKFALADVVDQRVSKWRAGKEGNLRALLSTLETVLWDDSGWRKVGMGDVLLPGKVKLVYMKGIAKVHPDKVSTRKPIYISPAPNNVWRSFLRPPPQSRR